MSDQTASPRSAEQPGKEQPSKTHVSRHKLADRLFHWFMAASIFVLLGTAFLPIWGIRFDWLVIHWVTGIVLTVLILAHIVRAIFFQDLAKVWIWIADVKDAWGAGRALFGRGEAPKPGKYSLAQKAYHAGITLFVLAAIVTGWLMLVKQDTPWWQRNPYWLMDDQWGLIYVLHGLAAILIFAMLLLHIYFAIRPEKQFYTRSMIKGWITKNELDSHHDTTRWQAGTKQTNKKGE